MVPEQHVFCGVVSKLARLEGTETADLVAHAARLQQHLSECPRFDWRDD